MRALRYPLMLVLLVLLLFDLSEAARVWSFGWPPIDLATPEDNGVLLVTREHRVTYAVFHGGALLLTALLLVATWKAWRLPSV